MDLIYKYNVDTWFKILFTRSPAYVLSWHKMHRMKTFLLKLIIIKLVIIKGTYTELNTIPYVRWESQSSRSRSPENCIFSGVSDSAIDVYVWIERRGFPGSLLQTTHKTSLSDVCHCWWKILLILILIINNHRKIYNHISHH